MIGFLEVLELEVEGLQFAKPQEHVGSLFA
jgi:hypothetical protein